MNIVNLKQVPQYLQLLASWHQAEWAYLNPGQTLNDRIQKMQAYLNDDFIPSTFVAVNEHVLGSAAIIECDMEERSHLSPWLASVYVAPEFRRQGIGSALVHFAAEQARQRGFSRLYLYTPDQAEFYQRLGWEKLERVSYHGTGVSIMSIVL